MKRLSIIVIILLLLFSSMGASAQEVKDWAFRVKLDIAPDNNIRERVESYLNTELTTLKDVEIVEDDPLYELIIRAMEVRNKRNEILGQVIAVVTLQKFDPSLLWPSRLNSIVESDKKILSSLYVRPDVSLHTGSTENLRNNCKEIIADFNVDYLEELRRTFTKILEYQDQELSEDK